MAPLSAHSDDDGYLSRLPVRSLLAALVIFYAFLTYQFVRLQSYITQLPVEGRAMFTIDPGASLPAQYVEYLVSVTVLDWGTSIARVEPVTAILVGAVPWVVGLVAIAALLAGVALHLRNRLDHTVPWWLVVYSAYTVAFFVGFALLTPGPGDGSGFYLADAFAVRDYPVLLGARRLLVLGFLVGAVIVGVGRRFSSDETADDTPLAGDHPA